ncbi:MAG: hypothetical protein BGN88_12915 [Clostridiales bacterium 43-6]|nr:MAG: hypothetical protein BGN88_12915 [Clostridiales bacterium 43-6]
MKKYIVLSIITVIFLVTAMVAPNVIISNRPSVKVLTAQTDDIQTTVLTSGKVEETSKYNVKTDIPMVIKDMNIAVGDEVKKGDLLFTVDKDATAQNLIRIMNSGVTGGISQDTLLQYSNTENIENAFYADASGIVSSINLTDKVSNPNIPAIVIANTEKLQVKVSISEDIISGVSLGQSAVITGSGFKGREYKGTVTKIFPAATEMMGVASSQTVVNAIVSIDKPDKYLKPGFTAKVKIITDTGKNILIIPYESITQDENQKEYVYKIDNGRAVKHYIKTGREVENGVEILEGLKRGDRIAENPENIKGNLILVNTKAGDR